MRNRFSIRSGSDRRAHSASDTSPTRSSFANGCRPLPSQRKQRTSCALSCTRRAHAGSGLRSAWSRICRYRPSQRNQDATSAGFALGLFRNQPAPGRDQKPNRIRFRFAWSRRWNEGSSSPTDLPARAAGGRVFQLVAADASKKTRSRNSTYRAPTANASRRTRRRVSSVSCSGTRRSPVARTCRTSKSFPAASPLVVTRSSPSFETCEDTARTTDCGNSAPHTCMSVRNG